MPEAPLFVTVKEAARLLKCKPSGVRALIHAGTLPAIRIRGFKIPLEAIHALCKGDPSLRRSPSA